MKVKIPILKLSVIACICIAPVRVWGQDGEDVKMDRFFAIKLNENLVPLYSQGSSIQGAQGEDVERVKAKAFFRSLLVPGWGQKYLGMGPAGKKFLAAELALWGGWAALRTYGGWVKEDYKNFAALHARVDSKGKEHQFWVDIGNYPSVEDYNLSKRRDRNWGAVYDSPEYCWEWDSGDSRHQFENRRITSDRAFRSSYYVLAGVFLNHLISAVDAARRAGRVTRDVQSSHTYGDWWVGWEWGEVRLVINKKF